MTCCLPSRLFGELRSVRTTCLVSTYFLCVPTFLAITRLLTTTSTLPRYTPPSFIIRIPEHPLTCVRKIACLTWFAGRSYSVLEPRLCMLCISFIESCSASLFINVHSLRSSTSSSATLGRFLWWILASQVTYRYLEYWDDTRCCSCTRVRQDIWTKRVDIL